MAEVVARRLALAIPTLFGMSVIVFLIVHLVPGDPARAILGINATPALIVHVRSQLGLDHSLPSQYAQWLGNVLTGNFGTDYSSGAPIGTLLAQRLPVTIELSVAALAIATAIGIPLGVAAAVWRSRLPDTAAQGVSMLGISVPDFWLGIVLILLFSLGLGILPSSGWVPLGQDPVGNLEHIALPALALGIGFGAVLIRVTRAAMLDVLAQDYIRFCRAKGVSEFLVVFKHALRNAAIPITTVVGMQAGYLLGGAIVIEQVFSLPGVGQLVLNGVLQRDYPVVQGAVLVIGAMFIAVNLFADVLYTVLNPRLRRAPA
ncbi:MAG: ABC transporter permease [Solirubrobacteraceae bacterium]